ncbi:hypothetical protein HYFRA_00008468 [Hymenoscyphus fraxineus]|uniref:Uncharacterized protein n=1 Tax=Hymenoscyphus fraxineus TaxID=746836 RepID=A0A9N9KM33_9HELO|nr:hypothetical protein HYFRA_00008468 [Hymenoscyphus fraxineus]
MAQNCGILEKREGVPGVVMLTRGMKGAQGTGDRPGDQEKYQERWDRVRLRVPGWELLNYSLRVQSTATFYYHHLFLASIAM